MQLNLEIEEQNLPKISGQVITMLKLCQVMSEKSL